MRSGTTEWLAPASRSTPWMIGDLGLACRVGQHGLAIGEYGRHHQIFGSAHRHHREHHMRAFQTLGRGGVDVAFLEIDLGAELRQALEVQVDRPVADGAAAGQRHSRPAAARQQRPQHQDRGAHLAHQLVGRRRVGDFARGHRQGASGMAARTGGAGHLYQDTVMGQQVGERGDVGEVRQVVQGDRVLGQETGRHQRQRRVLGAADRDGSVQGLTAADADSVHQPTSKAFRA
jgi:hypothetical protein